MSLLLLFVGAGIQPWQRDDGYRETWIEARKRHERQLAAIALTEKMRRETLHDEIQMGIERRARESYDRLMTEQHRRRSIRPKPKKEY